MDRYHVELRAELQGDTLAGRAAVFGRPARLPGHWEQLAPGAFDAALERSDPRALVNHDRSLVLGRRSAGTLRLAADDDALLFEIDLPDTAYARDLRTLVGRGDIDGMSFGFTPGDDTWSTAPDGAQLRTHTSVERLVDISVVTFPAYEGTSVALRDACFTHPLSRYRSRLLKIRAQLRER